MNNKIGFCLILFLSLFSTGCSSIVKAEQPDVLDSVTIDQSVTYGQTFTGRFDGMDGIEIYLSPVDTGDGRIQLHLRNDPQNLDNIAIISLPLAEIASPGFYQFQFPAQTHSNKEDYYLILKVKGTGSVEVGTAPGNSYLDGAFYQGNQPKDNRQMTFQLTYYTPRLLIGLASEVLLWGWYLFVGLLLFVLPGLSLANIFWSHNEKVYDDLKISGTQNNSFSKLIIALGCGLAIYPVLFAWTDLIGLHIGSWYAWLPIIIGGVYLIWQFVTQWKSRNIIIRLPTIQFSDVILFCIVILIIITRFWATRTISLPLWGDSYHHTMITQLMIDNNGLFESWQPYTESNTFTYHFGFHAIAAVFYWIADISAAQTVLVVGQIINILAVLSIYPLALLIFKNKWSGIVALLAAGLLSPMPFYYVNWGRYTQLAGQIFLLIAVWFTWTIFKSKRISWGLMIPAWIVISSLAMTHYRVIIFYILFVLAYLIMHTRKNTVTASLTKSFWIGSGAGLIYLPWFTNVFAGRILNLFENLITKSPTLRSNVESNSASYALGDLTTYLPITLWILLLLVLAICFWQKNIGIATISLWWFILVLAANPHWLHLPGAGIIDNFAVFIAVYIPAGLIFATIPTWLSRNSNQINLNSNWVYIIMGVAIMVLGFWGTWKRHSEVDPNNFALAGSPDLSAANWIQENIPSTARFLVNSFFAYQNTVMVGSDGGWWLPLIAERKTTLPPITYVFEQEPFAGYNNWVQVPTRMIEENGINHPKTIQTLVEYGVTHVYIGQQQGNVNYAGRLRLKPTELMADQNFEPIYHQDRVWIFRFEP